MLGLRAVPEGRGVFLYVTSKFRSTHSSVPDYISMDIQHLVCGHVCLNLGIILHLCVCMQCTLIWSHYECLCRTKSIESVQRNFRHVYGKHSGSDITIEMHFVRFKETGSALRETSGTPNSRVHDVEFL